MEPKFDKTHVSKTLQALRREKAMTQAALAGALGISDKAYSRLETGDVLPDMESLALLAEFYGVSPALFFEDGVSGGDEACICRMYEGLSPSAQVEKSFEILFYAIRGLARNAIEDRQDCQSRQSPWDTLAVKPPENRVWPGHFAKTNFSSDDVYAMMYNGSDANIALSIMPNEENSAWLVGERDQLAALFALLADREMLALLPSILSKDFSRQYTAEYAAKEAGIDRSRAETLLAEAARLGLCNGKMAMVGEGEVQIYTTAVEHTLLGLLTLGHLILNRERIDGCFAYNIPCKITCGKETPRKAQTVQKEGKKS